MTPAPPVPGADLGLPLRLRTRLRTLITAGSRRLRGATYLRKWLVLGLLLGAVAGIGAVVFYNALALSGQLLLHDLAGYQVPTPVGEGGVAASPGFSRPWAIPLVVALGGLLAGVLVRGLAPEAEGHGTDAAISAVHDNPRGVRLRAVLVKIVASALTIGSGGSGGREGPTAQISAGFGSFLARALDLSPADGRIAVAIGIGSGIGAIFGAPLGGALLSAEILYRDDIEVEAIIPGIIAAIIGYTVFSAFQGFQPLFGFAGQSYQFTHPLALAWYAVIGVVGGVMGLAYAKSFYGMNDLFARLPVPRMARPALGGLLVGVLALGLPEVLGTGYGWIQEALGRRLLGLPLWVVLCLPLAKILATSLSIGSGGSGGIFGPGIFIGAFTGAAVWRLLAPVAPAVPHDPAPFVIVGMMACFGGISRAPLAVMLMAAEMTGSLSVLAPAMVAVGLATLIVRRADDTIYRSQLKSREDSRAHRLQASMPLLSTMRVDEVMGNPRVIFDARNGVAEAAAKLARERLPGAPVVDETGAYIGTVQATQLGDLAVVRPAPPGDLGTVQPAPAGDLGTVQPAPAGVRHVPEIDMDGDPGHGEVIGRLADPTGPTILASARLDSALEALMSAGSNWIPVLDEHRQVVGILSTSGVVRGYRATLRANLRQVSQVAAGTVVVDERVGPGAPVAGKPLRELGLPLGTIVMTLQRRSEHLLPRGDTVLEPGDQVGVLTHADDAAAVRRLLLGAEPPGEPRAAAGQVTRTPGGRGAPGAGPGTAGSGDTLRPGGR